MSLKERCDPKPNRWHSLIAGIYQGTLVGFGYGFPLFSAQLKAALGTNQQGLSLVSTFGTFTAFFSPIGGMVMDTFGSRVVGLGGALFGFLGYLALYLVTIDDRAKGKVLLAACIYMFAYQGIVWLDLCSAYTQIANFPQHKGHTLALVKTQPGLASSALAVLFAAFFASAHATSDQKSKRDDVDCVGTTYVRQSPISMVSHSLPEPVDFHSASSSSISLFRRLLNEHHHSESSHIPILFFFSLSFLLVGGTAAIFLQQVGKQAAAVPFAAREERMLRGVYAIVTLLLVYLGILSALNLSWQSRGKVPTLGEYVPAWVLLAFYLLPVAYVAIATYSDRPEVETVLDQDDFNYRLMPTGDEELEEEGGRVLGNKSPRSKPGKLTWLTGKPIATRETTTKLAWLTGKKKSEKSTALEMSGTDPNAKVSQAGSSGPMPYVLHDCTAKEAFLSFDFWMLAGVFFVCGAGYMTIYQWTQVNSSLGGSSPDKANMVMVFGLTNCASRMVGGLLQESLSRAGLTRPLMLFGCCVLMVVGQALLAFTKTAAGLLTALGIALTASSLGITWVVLPVVVADVVGSKNFGKIYSVVCWANKIGTAFFSQIVAAPIYDHVYRSEDPNQNRMCCGNHCYFYTFLITCFSAAVLSACPLALHCRMRSFYQQQSS